jgi:EAL domain-containing protein (putative c-di-GMP-specific phosphodiesterase class I)
MTVDDDGVPGRPDAHRVIDLALAEGGLRTLFQPIVQLSTGSPVGWEALSRGPSELEDPQALFAAARETLRLAELDWACRCGAFRAAAQSRLQPPARLFVNAEPQVLGTACPRHLLPDWVAAHRRLRVVVEVTERYLGDDPGELLRVAATLHELGWEVALDDVGADDAGVALLPVLRPDIVKLDKGLLTPRPGRVQRRVLKAVAAYVAGSGAPVVAEGIEHEDHRRRALELGADWGQGWLFGRPAPLPARPPGATSSRPARAQAREGADPRVRTDPFQLLAAGGREATPTTGAAVVAQVRRACTDALTLSSGSLVVVSLGHAALAPADLVPLLTRLQHVCSLVVLLAGEPGLVPEGAVRTTVLADGDPLGADAAVVLLSPERALAFHARQGRDGAWTARSTRDEHEVGECLRSLLTRTAALERGVLVGAG